MILRTTNTYSMKGRAMPVKQLDEEALFHAARRISARDARDLFLEQACAGNSPLAERVRALLEMHEQESEVAEAPQRRTVDFEPIAERAGSRVGPYRLMEQIGEGGFGLVFVAEQQEPVKRKVALKVIKPGMDTRQIIARFEAERQALALMDHPNIARVLDAGSTESGRPYFVMELVRGIPITEYCDQNQLTPRERLELFVTVCQAVQHAHQKGIIHRDIKPSNVLVGSHDGKPMAKVIDFGVAKAISQDLTQHTLYTNFAQMIGTPLYMSPEQAEMSVLDIDTRSDIYSLGVLLYELLTGSTPFDRKRFAKAAYDEIRRLIREEEPPRPSTRVSTSDSLPSIAAQRHTEPAKLSKLIRGDLDWITMKALEKDRTRRYETANGLAREIERYLHDEPVEACPPTAGYRLRKFARKHRAALTTAAAILLLLTAGIAASTWQAVRATNAERAAMAAQQAEAERAEGERQAKLDAEAQRTRALDAAAAEKAAKEQAQRRLTQIAKSNAVLTAVFDDLNINKVKAGTEPLEAVLAKRLVQAAAELEGESVGDPLLVAGLQHKLGVTLLSLGFAAEAIPLFEKARNTQSTQLGPDHPDTLATMNSLAEGYQAAGQRDKAVPLYEETLKRRTAKLGPDHPDTLTSMANFAWGYHDAGQFDKALPLLEETLKRRKAKLGADHLDTLESMNNLAAGYQAAGQFDKALPLFEETLKLRKAKVGPDHPDTLTSLNNLAACYWSLWQLDKSVPLFEELLPRQEKKLGRGHPNTLLTAANLGENYRAAGQLDKAVPLLEETVKLMKAKLGPDHPDTLASMNNLALGYQDAGQLDKALPLFDETLKLKKTKLGPDHPATLKSMAGLAMGYRETGKLDRVLPLLEEALKLTKAKFGPDHPRTLASMNDLALGYDAARQFDKALPLLEETLKLRKANLGPDHPDTLISMNNLALGYHDAGQLDKALPLYEQTLTLMNAKLGPDHPNTLTSMGNLALCYQDAGQLDKALPLFDETLKIKKTKLGPDHPSTLTSMYNLARGYHDASQLDKSVLLSEEVLARSEKKLGRGHPDTLRGVANLGVNYSHDGRPAEEVPLLEEAYRASKKHPTLRFAGRDLVDAYWKAGKVAEAAELIDELLADARMQPPKDSVELAYELGQCGLTLLEMKKFAEAEPLLRDCLAIREKTRPDAWNTFNAKSMLGGALLDQKKYADAEPLLLAGYEGMKQRENMILPIARIRIAEAIERLVQLYEATGKKDEAAKWRKELQGRPKPEPPKEPAPRLSERKLPEQSADKNSDPKNDFELAEKKLADGQAGEAVKLFEMVHKDRAEKLGKDHPQTMSALYGLGRAWLAYGEGNNAVACLEQWIQLQHTAFPPRPERKAVARSLAQAYRSIGKTAESQRLFEEVCKLYSADCGPDHPDTLQTQTELAQLYLQAKKYADAEAVAKTAHEHWQKRIHSMSNLDHIEREQRDFANLQSILGECLLREGQFADAEPVLLAGYEGIKKRAANMSPQAKERRLLEAIERLVQLYDATNKKDEADKWRKELDAAKAAAKP
jgi:eukaryotic-like serine/threonine-protein kinase